MNTDTSYIGLKNKKDLHIITITLRIYDITSRQQYA